MIILFTIVIILALITAFAFGLVTGENISKRDYIIDQWEEEEDDEHPGDDR